MPFKTEMTSHDVPLQVSTTRLEDFLRLPEVMNILPEQDDRKSSIVEDTFSKSYSYAENEVSIFFKLEIEKLLYFSAFYIIII